MLQALGIWREEVKITKQQFKDAMLSDGILKKGNLELLSYMFFADECEATAPQITNALGYGDKAAPANAALGNLGKRIAKHLALEMPERDKKSPGWWQVIATGEHKPRGFTWRLRRELAEALIELDLLIEPSSFDYPELAPASVSIREGAVTKVQVNAYERNPVARSICIEHYGCSCVVCGFDFEQKYGDIGKGFIHVHHLRELASIGTEYQVDPLKDLRPVCPNCHAMLHRRRPAFSIEELLKQLVADA
ncbi:HNH endonuclease [Marinobacter bryozoorum]|uniref:HNH endonuclease n=1 Tax=Marinobacter bryozoorum TaxID=256324 RepID=UPI002005AC6D|nr:HNH endonuclease [Marinobacter bryozoorum]MCK7546225.1 HNH endonuclease [Marinobacter bryozoorum]